VYLKLYEQIAEDTSEKIRKNELRAIDHSIQLMQKAAANGMNGRDTVEAVFFLSRLWGVLLEDLASRGNPLPEVLRAKLISIGIWVLRSAEEIRQKRQDSFEPIIAVSKTIAKGLAKTSC
jgi:flagellar biosynthesis activator protein FlaF